MSSLDGRLSDATALASRSYELERTILYATLTSLPREALDPGKGCEGMPGVFEVQSVAPISRTIDDLLRLADCSHQGEWEGQVRFLPL